MLYLFLWLFAPSGAPTFVVLTCGAVHRRSIVYVGISHVELLLDAGCFGRWFPAAAEKKNKKEAVGLGEFTCAEKQCVGCVERVSRTPKVGRIYWVAWCLWNGSTVWYGMVWYGTSEESCDGILRLNTYTIFVAWLEIVHTTMAINPTLVVEATTNTTVTTTTPKHLCVVDISVPIFRSRNQRIPPQGCRLCHYCVPWWMGWNVRP